MTTTGALPAPGTAEGRAALEQEARGHGFPDALAYTEAYADGRVDTRGVGDRPGDPRTGFGQIQAYAKAAALWGVLLVEYAALSPAGTPMAGPAPDHAPPPEPPDDDSDEVHPELPRSRDTDVPDRDPESVAPRPDTTFQSVAATVAVVDMADGEAFDGIHSLDLVTPPEPAEHTGPGSKPDTETTAEPGTGTAAKDLAFGTVTPDAALDPPVADGPVFGAGFPLVAGELGDPAAPDEIPGGPAEAFGSGTGDVLVEPVAGEAVPDVGDAVVSADHDGTDAASDSAGEDAAHDEPDDYADLGGHVRALDADEGPGDHTDAGPDAAAHDSHDSEGSGGESFT